MDDLRKLVESVQHFHLAAGKSWQPGPGGTWPPPDHTVICLYADACAGQKSRYSPWAKQLPLHRLIVDVIRLGTPQLAEQTLIHVTNSFLEAALTVWAH